MADITTYTHFDIDRYLTNKMTAQEMHDFEKAMMEDPFLADAFEGFTKSDLDVANYHLAAIEKELTFKKEPGKLVAISSASFAWWKVAAIILLIAGVGTITYRLLNMSVEPVQVASNKSMKSVAPQADSISPEQKPLAAPQLFPGPAQEALAKRKNTSPIIQEETGNSLTAMASPKNDDSMVAVRTMQSRLYKQSESKMEETASAQAARTMSMDSRLSKSAAPAHSEQNEFKGKVVDVEGEPIAFATIIGNNNVGAVADANGNFSIKAPDTTLTVSVQSTGYETAKTMIKSNSPENEILLKETDPADLAEVVVTALGKRKKAADNTGEAKAMTNNASGIEPETGWKQFHQYIFENLQHIKDTSDVYTSDDVALEFEVDSKGRPSKIKATEYVNKQNAENAIELLQKGPKWKRSKRENKGKVVVSF